MSGQSVHAVVGNILEPVFFGHSMELQPIVVLLSLMLWGSLWGIAGMVLAVPITAVLRIPLMHVDHPLPRYLARVLVGRSAAQRVPPPDPHGVAGTGGGSYTPEVELSEVAEMSDEVRSEERKRLLVEEGKDSQV